MLTGPEYTWRYVWWLSNVFLCKYQQKNPTWLDKRSLPGYQKRGAFDAKRHEIVFNAIKANGEQNANDLICEMCVLVVRWHLDCQFQLWKAWTNRPKQKIAQSASFYEDLRLVFVLSFLRTKPLEKTREFFSLSGNHYNNCGLFTFFFKKKLQCHILVFLQTIGIQLGCDGL